MGFIGFHTVSFGVSKGFYRGLPSKRGVDRVSMGFLLSFMGFQQGLYRV